MKRLLALAVLPFVACPARAQIELGGIPVVYSYLCAKVLADPIRPRVYIADEASDSLVVIDTTTLAASASVLLSLSPVDMTISPDGSTIYVASQNAAQAITVIDLSTLTSRAVYPLPTAPLSVSAGLDGRVYAAGSGTTNGSIYQFDGATGALQTTITHGFANNRFAQRNIIQVTPDGKTLYVASMDDENLVTLDSFDVSTATPAFINENSDAGEAALQLVASHNSQYLCVACGYGNSDDDPDTTFLYAVPSANKHLGSFNNGAYPGPLAFSPDDSLVYQTYGETNDLQIFSTQTFALLHVLTLPHLESDYPVGVSSVVADNTGTYLFICQHSISVDDSGNISPFGRVLVVGTGLGTLAPPLPIIAINPLVTKISASAGIPANITVSRVGDLTKKLVVRYVIKGSAENGTDYALLTGKAKIKPGQDSVTIQVVPIDETDSDTLKTVKLVLTPKGDYTFGGNTTAKIKIRYDTGD